MPVTEPIFDMPLQDKYHFLYTFIYLPSIERKASGRYSKYTSKICLVRYMGKLN